MNGLNRLQARAAKRRGGDLWQAAMALAEILNFPLDDFQISLIVIAIRRRSVFHISAMRKIGKTHILGFMCLLLGVMGYTGVYTNHRKEFVIEFFEFVRGYAQILKDLGIIRKIEPSNGFHNIHFHNGAAIYFRTRSSSFGRGGMKLDYVFFDEAQKVHEATQTEVSGTMLVSSLKLEVHVGNPATKKDLIEYPTSPFTKAKIDGNPNFIEFSGADRYSEDLELTPELLAECNPNAHRLGDLKELLDSERAAGKSHEVIAAELFGIWNLPETYEKIEPEFSRSDVNKILTTQVSKASKFWLSVAMDFKTSEAYMVVTDGVIMEVARVIELPRGSVEPVADWILKHKAKFRDIFIMGTSKGKTLAKLLSSIPKRWTLIEPMVFAVSLNRFMQQTTNGTLLISETEDVRAALGSFWISYDAKTNAPIAKASTPEQVSLLMSLMMGAVDQKAIDRIQAASGAPTVADRAQELERIDEPETIVVPEKIPATKKIEKPQPPALDSFALYQAQLKAAAANNKEMAHGS